MVYKINDSPTAAGNIETWHILGALVYAGSQHNIVLVAEITLLFEVLPHEWLSPLTHQCEKLLTICTFSVMCSYKSTTVLETLSKWHFVKIVTSQW